MNSMLTLALNTVASFPTLAHWSEEIVKAKVRLYRARSEKWLVASIAKDAELIGSNAAVIDSLPSELRDAARPPKAAVKATKAKAKASRPKRAVKVS